MLISVRLDDYRTINCCDSSGRPDRHHVCSLPVGTLADVPVGKAKKNLARIEKYDANQIIHLQKKERKHTKHTRSAVADDAISLKASVAPVFQVHMSGVGGAEGRTGRKEAEKGSAGLLLLPFLSSCQEIAFDI